MYMYSLSVYIYHKCNHVPVHTFYVYSIIHLHCPHTSRALHVHVHVHAFTVDNECTLHASVLSITLKVSLIQTYTPLCVPVPCTCTRYSSYSVRHIQL